MRIGFLRHGPTAWNAEKRLQGHMDIPLSARGRAEVARYRLPEAFRGVPVFVSPLSRARETAALIGAMPGKESSAGKGPEETGVIEQALVEMHLVEMHWGDWEGETLAALRARYGSEMKTNEARGLDFRPGGGESPREVQARLRSFFARLLRMEQRPRNCLAVTHKGVIRAALALAHGWDMRGKAPLRLDWSALHVFRLGADGTLEPDAMNVSLLP